MARKKYPKRDIYQEVTDTFLATFEKIQAAIKAGTPKSEIVVPWSKSWDEGADGTMSGPRNGKTGRSYRGMNVLLLSIAAYAGGYSTQEWFTYKAAADVGGQVRKGEKSTLVTFWRIIDSKDTDPMTGKPRKFFLLKHFNVFNRDQCDNLPESRFIKTEEQDEEQDDPTGGYDDAQAVIDALDADGCKVLHQGSRASYDTKRDVIHMPPPGSFKDPESYWSTGLHECTHATGASSRCSRPGIVKFDGFGSEQYAFEELVAEIGSAFLCNHLGVPTEGLQHFAYVDHWIETLKRDKRAIVSASSKAQKACDWLLQNAGLLNQDQDQDIAAK